ncbi:glycine-rich domain-containing protein, partial [uncultured Flavobacterium sp.]|uniref:glycine-rich domain-containing protein n=1 Tax=uncultured Flavobacterium sp. TaxID=165435 RepID=UPI0030EF46C2
MKNSYPNLTIISHSNALSNAFKKQLFFIFAFFATITQTHAQTTVTYTNTGTDTFTVPCGVTSITVEAWGAGAGGQRVTGNPAAGGGGSGGGYVRTNYTVIPGNTYNLSVGTGGTGNSGGDGTASWFNSNTTILAVGGRGLGT